MFKKLVLGLSFMLALSAFTAPIKTEASTKAIAITGLALGGAALGVAAYDHFHHNQKPKYWHGRRYW